MKIELEDVMFWMDAIRNSESPHRTLESFWKGQLRSKAWLVDRLQEMRMYPRQKIVIHGGWNGVLANLLFNSLMDITHITSVDIDHVCEDIATTINKRQEMEGRFTAVTADMCDYKYDATIVINTSCEHITQEQYEQWLENVPNDALIVLQSNDYFAHEEHIRCATDIEDFIKMSNITGLWSGIFETPMYNRFMIIGKKRIV